MNKIILTGNLTKAPEIKMSRDGLSIARFGLAVKRPFSKNDEADFFNITAFGKTAEFCEKYFDKGHRAIIEGRLQTSNYTDKDGNKRTGYEVTVDSMEFADSKKKETETADDDYSPPDENEVDVPF